MFILLATLLICCETHQSGYIISDIRRIEWAPGIPGGIPVYPVSINVKNSPYNAKGDGLTDDTAAINQAVANCPEGTAIYLPEGRYRFTSEVVILHKSIALRGDGPDRTFIKGEGMTGDIIKFVGDGESAQSNVISGAIRGSREITVNNSTSYNIGDLLIISEENDPAITEGMQSYQRRAVGQMFMLTSKNGNTLGTGKPLYFTYNPAMDIKIGRLDGIRSAGIEDLTVERTVNGGLHNIEFKQAIHCWVKNVQSLWVWRWHVRLEQSYGCEVRGSAFLDGRAHAADAAYGVGCIGRSTDNLIEDNIFYRLRHSMIIEYGGCGNVYGYNYSKDPINEDGDLTNFLMPDMELHGGHPYMNLFEGNIGAQMSPEYSLGSSRHNTFFRNYVETKSIPTVRYGLWAANIEWANLYQNFVGNILLSPESLLLGNTIAWRIGYKGNTLENDPRVANTILRHGNYDYLGNTIQWDPNISDRDIPNSLYLKSKPAFFSNYDWPAIGPDLIPMVKELPARKRFELIK